MSTRQFGEPVQRNADPALLKGEGAFIDDISLPGALHAAFVRSQHARARIRSIDMSEAEALPDVVAVYTADEIGALDVELPMLIPHPCITSGGKTQRPLARDDVFYAGQCIAMVVAVDRYTAEDACAAIEVEYEPLPVELDLEKAIADGAPLVHDDIPNNVAAHFIQGSGDADAAFAAAEHTTTVRVGAERSSAAPMECRAVAARWDGVSGELTVWDSTQATISVRGGLASLFDIDEDRIRVIAPNVGGGFGQKIMMFHPDEILVPFAAMQLDRPVKYIEDRVENFIGASQERAQIHEISLAAKKDGTVLALRDSFIHDTGAFIPYGIAVAQVASTSIAGPYRIPHIWVEMTLVYTPCVQVTPYRGCGRPQACFAIERALDQLADELGIDRTEIRRRNFIGPGEFPYVRDGLLFADGLAVNYDSGEYEKALDLITETIGLAAFREEQEAARAEGRYLGFGIGFYVEGTGLGPYEGGHVKVHPITGKVYVTTGLTSQGQGHETVFAQIAADQVGCDVKDVIFVEGDTQAHEWGVATFASRAAVVSGNAIHKAAVKARARIIAAAANMLETDEDSIELRDGRAWIVDGNRSVSLAEIATASNPLRYAFNEASQTATQFAPASTHDGPPLAEGTAPGIEETDYFSPSHATWAYGVHAAIVEFFPDTCAMEIRRYLCIHDCGNMINPMIVEGQVMGGIGQGIGGAFYERCAFDENGTPLAANFMDFLMPYATEVPDAEILHMETPSPLNPLGIKGVGEAGTIPVSQVIASAMEDAFAPLGIAPVRESPMSPDMIHRLLSEARAR
ncbi:MAG: aerobic carbon-monoxide dehydrogenase large subunit [Defluviicoccus sp.]|nr:aerobic carbon-monoxide dehydrogenase large subunit [Defluviicoccus sp.]